MASSVALTSTIASNEGIEDNLRFLLVEVEKQLGRAEACLKEPDEGILVQVRASDDYIDNLATVIQGKTLSALAKERNPDSATVAFLKANQVVALNLERISDFCERLVDQQKYVQDRDAQTSFDFSGFFAQVKKGLQEVGRALLHRDHRRALSICRREKRLDVLYAKVFSKVLKRLADKESGDPQTLVTVLFMAHYLERMGDSLLNIGEAVLSACLGERIRFDRLETLESTLDNLEIEDLGSVELKAMGETKSGTTVAELSSAENEQPSVILKEGKTRKIVKETEAVERWNQLIPGVAPRVVDFQEGEQDSAAVFEFVSGATFENHLLHSTDEATEKALLRICETVTDVWLRTKRDEAAQADYTGQIKLRLPDVWAVHPEFSSAKMKLGGVKIAGVAKLVEQAAAIDVKTPCPFSCTIHGDFNVDNMLYDASRNHVRFIDLHRSRPMDYVQDVSVFLVSNLRMQVFDKQVRRRINRSTTGFYRFAQDFAKKNADASFEIRLALGMARSFLTSTRFVLDERLARTMFHRSRYLLERLLDAESQGQLKRFQIPQEVLID